jgi:flagellum-specific ATP synthase
MQNHYPAIDLLDSISRLMVDIVPEQQNLTSNMIRDVLATYSEAEDLINIGAYVQGSNPKIDYARSKIDDVKNFLVQKIDEKSAYDSSLGRFNELFADRTQPQSMIGVADGDATAR